MIVLMTALDTRSNPVDAGSARRRDDRLLLGAAALFTIALLSHNADHVRRGADAVAGDVFWVGTAAIAVEVAVVVLVCQRHRLAPLVAMATGWSLAAGYLLVHFFPARGWLSDSLATADGVTAMSWVAASLEVVAAVALGVAGFVVVRRRGGLASALSPAPDQRGLRAAVVHPLAATMIVGNAVLLLATAFQR